MSSKLKNAIPEDYDALDDDRPVHIDGTIDLDEMTICNLEVLVMPNGEILCNGYTVGRVRELGKYLTKKNEAQ